jgi:hypothetical protein
VFAFLGHCLPAWAGPFVLDQLVFADASGDGAARSTGPSAGSASARVFWLASRSPSTVLSEPLTPRALRLSLNSPAERDGLLELRQVADPAAMGASAAMAASAGEPAGPTLAQRGPRLFGRPDEAETEGGGPESDEAASEQETPPLPTEVDAAEQSEASGTDSNAKKSDDEPGRKATDSQAPDDPTTDAPGANDSAAGAITAEDEGTGEESGDDEVARAESEDDQAPDEAVAPDDAPPAGPQWVGERLAPGMMVLIQEEIAAGLQKRRIVDKFNLFRSYAARKLDSTAGDRRTSEVTGNCRLKWYDRLLRNPLQAPVEAEEFTRELHRAVLTPGALGHVTTMAAARLDLRRPKIAASGAVDSPEEAIEVVRTALTAVQLAYAEALAPLSKSELRELSDRLYPVLTSEPRVGHTLSRRSTGRRLCDLLEHKVDRAALMDAAGQLTPLTDDSLLEQLGRLPDDGATEIAGASGTIVDRIGTASGDIVIGGRGKNVYHLDEMSTTNVVIDLGGDDTYHEGTCSLDRPVLIVIDLDGNDAYQASRPGVQGGAILGVSMLLDAAGDDVYKAKDVAQGSCVGGVGILMDRAGNDTYVGVRRMQGQAIAGLGLLVDGGGSDRYHAAMWAQGFGGPMGFGVLDDLDGDDHYYAGGLYPDSYDETPGYEGWSQGIGAGIRAVADGGIGAILDGGGDDTYEFDYISHGGGYWLGLGFARDFAGDDQRLGATRVAYNGSRRTERRFQRFSNGFGCHYALGFTFDDAGDDSYDGTIMGVGYAWDCAVGYLCDLAGNDRYEATGGGTQGNGAQAGLGVLFDYDGDDVYRGYGQGRASSSISYHDLPGCGGNFSFVIDYGGTDKYGCGARNNGYIRRGSSGGFLIDRPKRDEIEETANSGKNDGTAGS